MNRHVKIVILTWNGLKYTKKCLETLLANTTNKNFSVVVVDNGSNDGTVEYLKSRNDITAIFNQENLGFVGGNNIAIEDDDHKSDIILLNNDTEILAENGDWIDHLQTAAHAAVDIGIVGCRIRRPNGLLQHVGSYMPVNTLWGQQIASNEEDVNQYPYDTEHESVVFACAYLKRELIEKIGGLSKEFFAYFEDTDYCLKAKEAGFRTICSGQAVIVHHENVSTIENKISHSSLFKSSQTIFKKKWAKKLAAKYDQQIVWHSTVTLPHGYGMSSKEMLLHLDKNNVKVAYRYLYGRGTVFPIDEPDMTNYYLVNEMKQRHIPRNVPHIVYGQGDAFKSNQGAYKIGYTMLEVTGIPEEWARQANMMDEVWVPTEFNRKTFRDSGVTKPIHIMPLGVDTQYFNPEIKKHPISDDFKFLTVFEWGERKAPELLIKAFNQAFKADEPVVLLCKANCTDPSVDVPAIIKALNLSPAGGRIEFIFNKYVPYYQLGTLYRSTDCFVLASRGEGWGMPILEAMACGLPAISTFWSAPTQFMTEANSYPLQVKKLVNAVAKCPYYQGFKWAEPDFDHLKTLLRHVFENQAEAQAKGARAAKDVQEKWSFDNAAKNIKRRLAEIEVERGLAKEESLKKVKTNKKNPVIALDVSRAIGEQISGVGRHILNIVRGLTIYPPKDIDFLLLAGFGDFVHPEYGKRFKFDSPATDSIQLYRGPLPAFSSNDTNVPGTTLLHSTGNMTPEIDEVPMLMTVYDLSFLTHPQYHTQENIKLCKENYTKAINRGAWFTAISENTKKDLVEILNVDPKQVFVVPCTYDEGRFFERDAKAIEKTSKKYKLPSKFLLFLASNEPRKNLISVIEAVIQNDLEIPLVVAGAQGWLNQDLNQKIADNPDKIISLGYIDDKDIGAIYSAAQLLVYPSLYEGFGLPVLEAMACGTPVITTNISSLPEVAGKAAILLDDPKDIDAIAHAIRSLLSDDTLYSQLRSKGFEQAKKYSLEAIAHKTNLLYRTLLKEC